MREHRSIDYLPERGTGPEAARKVLCENHKNGDFRIFGRRESCFMKEACIRIALGSR